MSEQVPEEVFVLRVEEQIEGVARFLDAVGIVPDALQALSAEINATQIGDIAAFQGKGAALAQAVAAGYQASIRGALAGGLTPADFALQSVGGDDLRRALQGQADAAIQYARALQQINEATARARALGLPALGAGASSGPGLGANVSSRLQQDQTRAVRFEDKLTSVLERLERQQNVRGDLRFTDTGRIEVGTQRIAEPVDLPNAREERALRRQADQAAIDANRAILDSMQRRATAERTVSPSAVPYREDIEERLGNRNASTFLRGRELPSGTLRRLEAEQRVALFGSEDIVRGAKVRGPGFTTPEAEFARMLQERVSGNRAGFTQPLELQTAGAASADAQVRAENERARQAREIAAARRQAAGEEIRELQGRLREVAEGRNIFRQRPPQPRALPFPSSDQFDRAIAATRRLRMPEEMVTVFRGSNEPLDLNRVTGSGLRVTQDRSYAEQHGGDRYLYSAQVPKSLFPESPFNLTGDGRLPHTYLTAEQAAALQPVRVPEPPPLPRGNAGGPDYPALVRRMRGAGLEDDAIVSGLSNMGLKTSDARSLVGSTDGATQAVRRLAAAVDDLGRESTEAARTPFVSSRQGVVPPGGFVGDNLPLPTGETLAETRLRLQRSQRALEGTFPREDIAAGRALRDRLLGGSPLAIGVGGGRGGLPIPFAGSASGGFPNGPFDRPPPPPGARRGPGPGGFGENPFDFDELGDRASSRSRNRRFAREAFEDTDPTFENATQQERARRQEQADRQFRQRATSERMAHEENRRFDDRQGGLFSSIGRSFGGPSGSFTTEFGQGVRGRDDNLGFQLGQTARFSVLYGAAYSALFAVSQAISAAAKEAVAYEDALVSLGQATGRSRSDLGGLAENLSESSARAGLAPSVGVAVGAQAIGLFGANTASRAVQDQTAEVATRVATQVARVTGADPRQVVTDLAGTLRSLGLGAASAPDLQDSLTFISRQTGRGIGDLLPALSNVGTLGTNAGFTGSELAAIIGQVTSTTGQTPAAAAGSFRQVLSRADDPNFNARVGQQFGFDATGMDLADIFKNVAATNPDTEAINQFSLLFGRGASQQVAQIITRDFGRISGLATGAEAAAGTGLGAQDFAKVRASIGGQIQGLGTDLLELGQDLVDTGIVDSLLLIVKTMDTVVNAIDYVVDAFNQIPRPLRSVAFAIAELLLISRIAAVRGIAGAAGGALVSAVGTAAGSAAAAGTSGLTRAAVVGSGAAGNLLGVGTTRGALLRFGAGGLVAAGIADAAGNAVEVRDRLVNAEDAFGGARTAADLTEAAAVARDARDKARERSLFGLGNLVFGTGSQADAAESLRVEARRQAAEVSKLEKRTLGSTPEAAFQGFDSVDSVNGALSTLADRGFTATDRLNALNTAFDAMIAKSTQGTDTLATVFQGQGRQFGAAVGRASTRALVGGQGATGLLRLQAEAAAPSGLLATLGSAAVTPLDFVENLTGGFNPFAESGREKQMKFDAAADALDKVNLEQLAKGSSQAALDALKGRGKDPAQGNVELNQGDITAINKAVLDSAKDTLGPALQGVDKATRQQIIRAYAGSLAGQVRGALGDFSGENVTPAATGAFLAGALTESTNAGAQRAIETGDPLLGAGTRLGSLRAARDRVTSSLGQANLSKGQRAEIYRQIRAFDLEIQQGEDDAMSQRVERANALAEVEKSNLGLDDTVGRRAVDLRTLRGNLRRTRNPNERARIQAQINEGEQQQDLDRQAAGAANDIAGVDPRSLIARTQSQLSSARSRLALLTPGSQASGQARDEIAQLEQTLRQQRVDRANAEISASVAGNDSGTARARASLSQARNSLSVQLQGTQAYYDALAGLQQAKRDLALAELQAAEGRQALEGDQSDSVETARDAVANARRRLRADQASGQGADVLAADRGALIGARLQQDSTEFSQNLGDVQVAEQLGNISHQQYLSYLRSERTRLADRLSGMKRTDDGYRQAVEQLQQIDLAVKSATDSLDGLFNLGDIKVPTPFEVRRSLAGAGGEASTDFTSQLISVLQSNQGAGTTITFNGADTAKVRAILSEYLGPQATGRGKKRRGA